ncbi:MAG: discoidin domain-containing protein [Akkermansiaceae bacterium]|nr:discoidin domain-containing protein [Akkermansiaceae bacterium]MCP5545816.1 discoidin domain-containing protein [Akkermansiaceae bacterium]
MPSAFRLFLKRVAPLARLVILSGTVLASEPPARFQPWDDVKILSSGWRYSETPGPKIVDTPEDSFRNIGFPHSWNGEDSFRTANYRRAASVYRKTIDLPPADPSERWFLRFGAAFQEAKVFFNGRPLLEHTGGFSAFTGEITGLAREGANTLDVWVSNTRNDHIAPHSADFTFYGGLYRNVELIRAPQVCFSRDELGGPGVRLEPELKPDGSATLDIRTKIDDGGSGGGSYTIDARLTRGGNEVARGESPVAPAPNGSGWTGLPALTLAKADPWSPESPALYELELCLSRDGRVIDRVRQRTAFRRFRFDAEQGFFLNGAPYKLRGTNRHQDRMGRGNALTEADHFEDVRLMKEAGCNWLRLAHYQQDDYMLQLCDELGLLVWEEIPYVNGTSQAPEFEQNLRSMMTEMIAQHRNQPSIIVWGMGNEVRMKDRGDGKADCYDIVKRLNDLVHRLDPARRTIFVIGDADYGWKLGVMTIPDLVGYNLYRGWYFGSLDSLTDRLQDLHRHHPGKPLVLSEFGAGSDIRVHSAEPARYDFSEEYQVGFLESHLDQTEKLPFLVGVNWWCFADFGSAARGDTMPHINQKGLVTIDRKVRKDAYHLLTARWTDTPVLEIQSKRWTERTGEPRQRIRVITNQTDIRLAHNGRDLGPADEGGCVWNVELDDGTHTFTATARHNGKTIEDRCSFTFKPSIHDFDVSVPDGGQGRSAWLLDGNPATHWAIEGDATIGIDLRRHRLLDGVELGFYRGESRVYRAMVEVSDDGRSWKPALDPSTDRPSGGESERRFETQIQTRHLRLRIDGNNENHWSAVTGFRPLFADRKRDKSEYETIAPE